MTDELTNPNSDTTPEPITLESVSSLSPDSLSNEQKTFIKDNAGELSDEQKETFKSVLEAEEESENIDPEKVEIKTRGKSEEKEEEKEEEDGEEDEIDPEDKKTIGKVVDDKLSDFRGAISEVQTLKDEQEVNNYLLQNPEYKSYKDVVLKYLAHPVYKNVPVENIIRIVAGNDMKKIGARMEREAAERVKATQDTGTTIRKPQSGKTNWLDAPKEAFEKKKNEVLGIK